METGIHSIKKSTILQKRDSILKITQENPFLIDNIEREDSIRKSIVYGHIGSVVDKYRKKNMISLIPKINVNENYIFKIDIQILKASLASRGTIIN